jgi:hypothetical protein
MHLHLGGPFQWITPDPAQSVFDAPQAGSPGIYLWTSRCADGYLASYVGETGRDFRTRTHEHLREQLAGLYTIRDPEAFCSGSKALVWRGLLGRSAEPGGLVEYVRRLPDLVPALVAPRGLQRPAAGDRDVSILAQPEGRASPPHGLRPVAPGAKFLFS